MNAKDLEVMINALKQAMHDPRYKRNAVAQALFRKRLAELRLGGVSNSATRRTQLMPAA